MTPMLILVPLFVLTALSMLALMIAQMIEVNRLHEIVQNHQLVVYYAGDHRSNRHNARPHPSLRKDMRMAC